MVVACLQSGVDPEGLPSNGRVGKSDAIQTTFQSAEGRRIELGQADREEAEWIRAFGLERRREKVVAVDEQTSGGMRLEAKDPE